MAAQVRKGSGELVSVSGIVTLQSGVPFSILGSDSLFAVTQGDLATVGRCNQQLRVATLSTDSTPISIRPRCCSYRRHHDSAP